MKYIVLSLGFLLISTLALHGQINQKRIDSLSKIGDEHFYTLKDSAYFYFDRTYELAKVDNDNENLIQSLFNLSGVASYHYDLRKMGVSLIRLDSILKYNTINGKPDSKDKQNIYLYYKGDYQLKLFEYDNSRKTFEEIVGNVKNTPDSLQTPTLGSLSSAAYSFLGKIHMIEGKYDLAKQLYNQNIRNILNTQPDNLESLYGNYRLLSEVYRNENKYFEANRFLLKTFQYNKDKGNTNTIITSAFSIAENYNQLSKKDSALHYLSEAKTHLNDNPVFYPKFHLGKSKIHRKNGELELALEELQKCIEEVRQKLGDIKNSDLPIAYDEIGNIHKDLGNYDLALKSYGLGLEVSFLNSERNLFAINLLKNKSDVLNLMDSGDSYDESLNMVDLGNSILDSLKPTFKNNSDKLFLIENAFPLFESGLEASYQKYESNKENVFVEKAFYYAEKSKSVLLLEALLSSKATEFADIPNDLLERERQLKSEITFIEKEINRLKNESSELEDQLFNLRHEHRNLIQTIETSYPSYYNLKYNTQVLSATSAQRLLTDDEMVISFFYGNKSIYSITLTKESKSIYKIPLTEALEEKIRDVHQMLGNPKSDISLLATASYSLYNKILQPAIRQSKKSRLIIFPDGLLNYIPFGSLNTAKVGIRYLVEDKSVAYANSATLWMQLREQKNENNSVLAFAPSFENNSHLSNAVKGKLLPLPNNTQEVELILTSFDGDSFLKAEASLSNFNANISKHGILHLATHAIFDDAAPEYSYLAFAQEKDSENLLYVRDLYNLSLDAGLVTLSACESGIGELKRGEGFLSLARGFFYSGAASITSTLWKINDASTTKVMDAFYKNLAESDPKDLAMRKAKNSFLESNRQNGLSHPYYWSGFIVSGNTAPLVASNSWTWVAVILGILILFGILLYRKKLVQRFQ